MLIAHVQYEPYVCVALLQARQLAPEAVPSPAPSMIARLCLRRSCTILSSTGACSTPQRQQQRQPWHGSLRRQRQLGVQQHQAQQALLVLCSRAVLCRLGRCRLPHSVVLGRGS